MFFFFSSFSLLQVMGEEKQTVVPKPFAEFLSENMKKTDGAFPVYQEGNRVYMEFPRKWNGREIEVSGQIDHGFGMINRSVNSLGVVRLSIPDSMTVEFLNRSTLSASWIGKVHTGMHSELLMCLLLVWNILQSLYPKMAIRLLILLML